MRIILRLLCFIICSLCFYSCSKTQEELIEEKFQNYVYENFDNPTNLKEVISIQLNDSIDKNSIFEVLSLTYKLDTVANELLKTKFEYISKLITNEKFLREIENVDFSYYDRERLRDIILEIMPSYMSCLSSKIYLTDRVKLDSVYLTIDSLNFFEYEISCRLYEGEKMNIEKYYAVVNDTEIKISNKTYSLADFSETSEFWDLLKSYNNSQEKYLKKVDNLSEIIDEFISINQKYGIVTDFIEEWYK